MELSKIKLIVSDMDGTLLNSKHEVSSRLYDILPKLKDKNIRFCVASGRQYYSLMERMERVKDEIIYIAENGALVMEGGEQVHIQPMNHQIALKVIKKVRDLGGKYLILGGRKKAYIESTDPEFMDQFLKHYEKYEVVSDLTQIENEKFLKLTVCDLSGAEKNTFPHVRHFEQELQVKLSGKIWVDFTDLQAQKGNALRKVQEIHGISKEETIAFGDYLNDIELFELAAYTFAMENAHEDVKEIARYAAGSNDEFGVEEVLENLLGGNRIS